MSIFKYKALDKEGKSFEGQMDVSDKFAVYRELKSADKTVVSVEEVDSSDKTSLFSNISLFSKVKNHDKIMFAKNLGSMIEAGLPITKALSIMERQAKGKLKEVIVHLQDEIGKGRTLSDSMKDFPDIFSFLFVSMVRAGEESGNLVSSLKNVGSQMEKNYQLTKKVRGAMMYPAVIFSLMFVIGILMMIYMVPTLTSTFIGLGIKLPLSTRIIIAISNILKGYILYIVIALAILGFSVVKALKTVKGMRFLDWLLLHFPLIKEMVKQINSARTARTLSSLVSSGVDIVVAISVTKDVIQNSYYKDVLEKAQKVIEKGEPISTVFTDNSHLYPIFVGEMISVGEETGKMGEMLSGIANFYEEEVDQKTKDLSSIIEPILMIFIGVAVGAFAISMLAPTYSLVDAI